MCSAWSQVTRTCVGCFAWRLTQLAIVFEKAYGIGCFSDLCCSSREVAWFMITRGFRHCRFPSRIYDIFRVGRYALSCLFPDFRWQLCPLYRLALRSLDCIVIDAMCMLVIFLVGCFIPIPRFGMVPLYCPASSSIIKKNTQEKTLKKTNKETHAKTHKKNSTT